MIKQNTYLLLIFTISLTTCFAQKSVNQYDKAGKRDGFWTKDYHQTDQKRYEGYFKNGKEIDTFKYYTLSGGKSVLSAVKIFNEADSIADVAFLSSNKMIISQGKMNGKRFTGQWIFYHKNSKAKMIVESYNDEGKLEGERYVYYKNGLVAEKAFYKNGMLDGESKWFSENNVVLKSSYYKDDKLEGQTINYDASGNKASEGDYVANKKEGIWKYYKDDKLTKEIDHTTQKVITKKQ